MRLLMRTSVIAAGALLLSAAAAATASAAENVEVRVPFPFVVDQQVFPAGQYLLEWSESGAVLEIRSEKNKAVGVFAMTRPATGHEPSDSKPELTFTRDENQYRLKTVWDPTSDVWRAIVP